jgi:hypothetical protein
MVHGIASVKYIIAILFAACVLLATSLAHAEDQRIAIVVNAESGITAISAKEARRAYLGASIVLNGIEIRPLLNQSDKLAGEVFLQRILFMSAEAYERQLISRSFQGGSRPKAYENLLDLLAALHKDNAAITFMLYETALNTSGIRIIGKL